MPYALDADRLELIAALRSDLSGAGFTVDGLRALWGETAEHALERGDRVAALRATAGDDNALAVLGRLFVLGAPAAPRALAAALPALGLDGAEQLGLVRTGEEGILPARDLRPYWLVDATGPVNWWIVSDLGELTLGRALDDDHVLGVGGASRTLSALQLPLPAERVLDLGTGCGIQAMHASRLADAVVATDISERALATAALNLALNGIDNVELRLGSLFEPVAGERFDRIVSNPPFVITPRAEGVPLYEYRDAGFAGDELVAAVVHGAAQHLAPGGVAQFLGNWEYRGGVDGLDRVSAWIADARAVRPDLDAWVVEREVLDAAQYSETWIRDGGTRPGTTEYERLLDAWLDDFERREVAAVGFGYVLLRRDGTGQPFTRIERREEPLGPSAGALGNHYAAVLDALDDIAGLDDRALARQRFRVAADVTEERFLWPGAEHPTAIRLRQGGAFGRAIEADTGLAAVVGASDGDLELGALVAAIAQLLEVDETALLAEVAPQVRELVAAGMLVPVNGA